MSRFYCFGLQRQYTLWAGIGLLTGTALLVIDSPLRALLIVAGLFFLVLIAIKPEVGVLTIVVLLSSIVFEESLPLIPIGIGSFHLSDPILLFMLGTMAFKAFAKGRQQYVRTPLDLPLALFLVTVLISICIAILQGQYRVDLGHILRQLRVVTYYLVVIIITNLIRSEEQIRFVIRGLFVIAGTVVVTMLIQGIIGESVQLMPGRIEVAETFGREYEALRMLPPGQTVIFFSLISAICVVVFREKNRSLLLSGYFHLILLLGIGVILTYNRHYWVGLLLALCLLMVLMGTGSKKRLLALLVAVTILAGSIVALLGGSNTKVNKTFDAVSGRFISLFAGKKLTESGSLEDRYIESRYAIEQIEKHPILGIGLGNTYRPQVFGLKEGLTYYIHNCYLWILTDTGLLGFIFFFLFYLRFIFRAMKNWKTIRVIFLKAVVVGFMISGIVFLFMAIVTPIFMEWPVIVSISTMIGVTESIIRNCGINIEHTDNTSSAIGSGPV